MKYELLKETAPILRVPCAEFDFSNPPCDPIELANDLNETMVANDGLGLSANQVGLDYRVFVIRAEDQKVAAFFNPKIVATSEKNISLKEGCLSFPLLYLNIKRPEWVRVRYTDQFGETKTDRFMGITCRVVLHEYDHMEGKVFTQAASKFESDRALRKRTILRRRAKGQKDD
jgi:peptide deformylase